MSSIDEIKKRKLEELKRLQEQKLNQNQNTGQKETEEFQNLQKEILALENAVKSKFTKDALARYGNLRAAHPKKALQLIGVLGQIISSGSLQGQISDEQLRMLLAKLSVTKEFKIMRK